MNTNLDLATHIAALNAKTAAWVAEDPKNRWAAGLCDDLAHWAQYNITTPAQLDHYLLVSNVYEATRDVFGYKPHWGNLNAQSDADLQEEMTFLISRAKLQQEAAEAAERAHKAATEAALNHKSGFTIGELVPL